MYNIKIDLIILLNYYNIYFIKMNDIEDDIKFISIKEWVEFNLDYDFIKIILKEIKKICLLLGQIEEIEKSTDEDHVDLITAGIKIQFKKCNFIMIIQDHILYYMCSDLFETKTIYFNNLFLEIEKKIK